MLISAISVSNKSWEDISYTGFLPLSNKFKGDNNEDGEDNEDDDDGEDDDDEDDNDRGFRNNFDSMFFNLAVVVVTFVFLLVFLTDFDVEVEVGNRTVWFLDDLHHTH